MPPRFAAPVVLLYFRVFKGVSEPCRPCSRTPSPGSRCVVHGLACGQPALMRVRFFSSLGLAASAAMRVGFRREASWGTTTGEQPGGALVSAAAAQSVCVYCASSNRSDPEYRDVAFALGSLLAERGYSIVYGGGRFGSMGALAEGALGKGGRVVGILPRFMDELEWGHTGLAELRLVEDMRMRKHLMLQESQGVVALPGGSGTLEELLEAMTLKRLGLYTHPIVLVNVRDFFTPLVTLLERSVEEHFMDERHLGMWQVVASPDDVPRALEEAPPWSADARQFAALL